MRNSIAFRLYMSLIVVTVPLLLASIWVSYSSSIRVLDAERASSESRTAFLGASDLSSYFKGLDAILLSAFRSNRFLTNLPPDPGDFYNASLNETFLTSLLYSANEIQYVYLYTPRDGRLHSVSKQMVASHAFLEASSVDWVRLPQESATGLSIGPPGPFVNHRSIGTVEDTEVFIMSRRLFDIETNKTLGILAIAVSSSNVRAILSKIEAPAEQVFLYSPNGTRFLGDDVAFDPRDLIDATVPDKKGIRQGQALLGAQSCLVTSVRFDPGFEIVMALPLSVVRSSATRALRINLFALIALSVVLLMTVAAVAYPFVSAVKRLYRAMRDAVAADFRFDSASMPPGGRTDEIGALRDDFVAMMDRIDRLINLEYRSRLENQEAKLRALQSQIDPHFINNTLQSIGTLALKRGARDVYGSLLALSRMIGYSTDPSIGARPLEEEVEQARRYVELQSLRFGERVRASYEVQGDAAAMPVPRLILQPLLENSIQHGLDTRRGVISIRISASVQEGTLHLVVSDTGAGMSPDELVALRAEILSASSVVGERGHIGLRNVAERIRLFSGGRGGLRVESSVGAGTDVLVEIPLAVDREETQ